MLTRAAQRAALVGLLAVALAAATISTSEARESLRLGFSDQAFRQEPAVARPWLDRAVESGSETIRLGTGWREIAPSRPADPEDPADPAYQWSGLDAATRSVIAAGLEPIVVLSGAPPWAEGPGRPTSAAPGSWRPDAREYRRFAIALGRRYGGGYPDPSRSGEFLPRVRYWQVWNEPNLSTYLTPQWRRTARGFVPASPSIYRSLQNEFYSGIKSRFSGAVVVSAGTAPFGDAQSGRMRMAPALFVRELFRRTTRFDVLAHHPYSVGGPFRRAANRDDVSVPDLGKLLRPLRRAERMGRALPRRRHPLWVTETSWDSSPPDPEGVPAARHARWLAESLYVLWRQGVEMVVWYLIRDQLPQPSYAATYQSGVYFHDGRPKRAQRAFALPFVALRAGSETRLWTRAPTSGVMTIERRKAGRWIRVAQKRLERGEVLTRRVRIARGTTLRARQDALTSVTRAR